MLILFALSMHKSTITVNPKSWKPDSGHIVLGFPITLLLRIEAIGFPTLGFYCMLVLETLFNRCVLNPAIAGTDSN